jgi:ATP-dependent Lon protease
VKDEKLRELVEFCGNQTYLLPPYRGKLLKRSPKATFVTNDEVGVYRFGQETRSYGHAIVGFPDPLSDLAMKIWDRFGGEMPNHCIIVRYSSGKDHHIPWHSDKQEGTSGGGAKDICKGTNIYDIIIFEQGNQRKPVKNRKFQVALSGAIAAKADGHGDASEYLYNQRTPNGELIVLTYQGNCELKHRVPKEKGNDVVRYSIVFRSVKTKEEQGVHFDYYKQEHEDAVVQGHDEDEYDAAMAEYYALEDADGVVDQVQGVVQDDVQDVVQDEVEQMQDELHEQAQVTQVQDEVHAQVQDEVEQAQDEVHAQVQDEVEQMQDELHEQAQVAQVQDEVHAQVQDEVHAQVQDELHQQAQDEVEQVQDDLD